MRKPVQLASTTCTRLAACLIFVLSASDFSSLTSFAQILEDSGEPIELALDTPTSSSISALHAPPSLQLSNLSHVLESQCALLCVPPCSAELTKLLTQLRQIFRDDGHVYIGSLLTEDSDTITWKNGRYTRDATSAKLAFYEREIKDRSCLLAPAKSHFKAYPYTGQIRLELLVAFLNEKCDCHRTATGSLNAAGLFHEYITNNLYRLEDDTNTTECARLGEIPDQETFFQQFLFRSRPVIIENATADWPAMQKWTVDYLRELYGNKKIHIKLTEDGEFEGVESAELWEDYREDWIPETVRKQLPYPDLVVVRPATAEMSFSSFLDFISSENRSYSAYLEYSSIPYHLPLLEEDVREMSFLKGLLERRHLNIWLSDGHTLGKLHFDPFDNFLCQISGRKHLTLFEPHHNQNLYEGHIPEAKLSFNQGTGAFHRKNLLESTSMVMSPVDIARPDLDRFPDFAKARRVECALGPGDVLFMPAFWWHEVQSYPDEQERRNLAVNFWYEPVLTKQFPCAECELEFNKFYRHFLYDPPL